MHDPDSLSCPQITDLSDLTAEDLKFRNTQFLQDPDQVYETGLDHSTRELRRRIWVVRNGDLRKVIRRFPTDDTLLDQCALWMQAMVGKHFFPDANHRTAVAVLRRLLRENNISTAIWSVERLRSARIESHSVRQEIESVTLDTIYQRDALYDVWREFFEDQLEVFPENPDPA